MVYLYSNSQHGCVLQLWVLQPWSMLYNRLKSIKIHSFFFRIEYHLASLRAITDRWMNKGGGEEPRLEHFQISPPRSSTGWVHPYQWRTGIPALQKLTKLGEASGKPGNDIQACLIPDASPMQKHAEIRDIF